MTKYLPSALFTLIFLCQFASAQTTVAETPSIEQAKKEEVAGLIQALNNNDTDEIISVAIAIANSGVESTQLFDHVELKTKRYLDSYNSSRDKSASKAAGHLLRALASSGDEKYRPFISSVVTSSRSSSLRNRAKSFARQIAWYRERNTIMNDFSNHQPSHSIMTTRWINLMAHPNPIFGRNAAESIGRLGTVEQPVIDYMANKYKNEYRVASSPEHISAVTWYSRMLGRFGKGAYDQLLISVKQDIGLDRSIRKHADRALRESRKKY